MNGWEWFGHSGDLQGYITRTCAIPEHDLAATVMIKAIDGWAALWADGAMHILRPFSRHGAPSRKVGDWAERWWSLWGAVDLVPDGNKMLVAVPGMINPIGDAGEREITGPRPGPYRRCRRFFELRRAGPPRPPRLRQGGRDMAGWHPAAV